MIWQEHSHGWAWEDIGPPTGEPGLAIQNQFFSTKDFITDINTPQTIAGEDAGGGGPGLAW